MAAAVLELFPETKLGHGPATESGFFYDFYREKPFTPEDLAEIEKKMQELVKQRRALRARVSAAHGGLDALQVGRRLHEVPLHRAIHHSPMKRFRIYKTGKFIDFCRGPHIPVHRQASRRSSCSTLPARTGWARKKNPQLQRIYGTSFFSKKDLDDYMNKLEEAKRRDHRVLGKQLDLFSIQELAGPGLIFWHPKGGTHPQGDGRLDARRVPEARLLAGVHAARGAPRSVADLRPRGLLRARTCLTPWNWTMRNIA